MAATTIRRPRRRIRPRRKPLRAGRRVVTRRGRGRGYQVAPPRIQRLCLKYVDNKAYTLTAASPYLAYMWCPNDMFDPDYTGVGHQAMMRDQYYQLYNWGRCIAYKITVKLISDNVTPVEICLCPVESPTTVQHELLMEYKGARKSYLSSNKPLTLSYKSLVDVHLGNRKYTALIDDSFKQNTAVLPQKAGAWVQMSAKNTTGAASVSFWYTVEIKQYVQYSEPLQQNQS